MSVLQMGLVWGLQLPHNQAWVLMAYADHADHDGSNVFPSIDMIAWKTGYSDRQVQRIVASLVNDGLMVPTKHLKGGAGNPIRYRLNLEKGVKKTSFTKKGDILTPFSGVTSETDDKRVTSPSKKGDILSKKGDISEKKGDIAMSQKGDIAMSPEPSLTVTDITVSFAREASDARAREDARETEAARQACSLEQGDEEATDHTDRRTNPPIPEPDREGENFAPPPADGAATPPEVAQLINAFLGKHTIESPRRQGRRLFVNDDGEVEDDERMAKALVRKAELRAQAEYLRSQQP